jgi:hypothetical protein
LLAREVSRRSLYAFCFLCLALFPCRLKRTDFTVSSLSPTINYEGRSYYRDILTAILTRYYEPGQGIEEYIMENQQKALPVKHKEHNNLLGLRLKKLIDDALFTEK